jgi:D-alanyl-D-alanine carboxypeptidase
MPQRWCRIALALLISLSAAPPAAMCAQDTPSPAPADPAAQKPVNGLPNNLASRIDTVAEEVLTSTGVPSASIAIVRNGMVAYTHAYGDARLDPETRATVGMRYSIGSISKQFTAAAVLLLQQDGKLSLDDPVSKYLPDLTRANEVTIRMLLSHTSGYQDYWPQDYLMPPMRVATTSQHILDVWAKKPLDFEPGTRWQYSNTNYVIAGRIVEQVSGMEIFRFLQQRIFTPLKMESVYNSDIARLADTDAQGYIRYALGPLRPAPKEGAGWVFAAGELAMPAYDLALWNISVMNHSLLTPDSYKQMFTSVKLKDGTDPHYSLGMETNAIQGHRALEHAGEVSGFVSENMVFPDDHVSITVLTNQDAIAAASIIAAQIAPILLGEDTSTDKSPEAQTLAIFAGLQKGQLDRSLFTENCNAYFSPEALDDFRSSLGPLGKPTSFYQSKTELRGGMTFRAYRAAFRDTRLNITTYTTPDGKLEQYLVFPTR